MVRVAGYDPATSCFPSKRATRLRYTLSVCGFSQDERI